MRAITILVVAGLACIPAAAGDAELGAAAEEGKRLYGFYCQGCHGGDLRGNGPTAEVLTVQPADLTALAKADGGEFPTERVSMAIDGRHRLPGHGSAMPIWGLGFQELGSDANQEEEVRRRIDALVAYLRAVQR